MESNSSQLNITGVRALVMSVVAVLALLGCDAQEGATPSLSEPLATGDRREESPSQFIDRSPPPPLRLTNSASPGLSQVTPQRDRVLGVTVRATKAPVVVNVDIGPALAFMAATTEDRRGLASRAVSKLVTALDAYPRRVIVVRLQGGSVDFESLPAAVQVSLEDHWGQDAAALYANAMSEWLGDVIDAVHAERSKAAVSVVGLPVESHADRDTAVRTNERYRALIDGLDQFVSDRSFMLLGRSRAEAVRVQDSLPEAIRLRSGRPVMFRTNGMWRVLVDEDSDWLLAEATEESMQT